MNKSMISLVVGLGLAQAACGKDEGKDSSKKGSAEKDTATQVEPKVEEAEAPKPEAKPEVAEVKTIELKIDAMGIGLDVPENWKGKQLNDNAYTMRVPKVKVGTMTMMPTFSLLKSPYPPNKGLDEIASCTNGKLVDKKDLGEGRLYYNCELDAGGQKMFALEWEMPFKKGTLSCSGSGPNISAMLAACKTIREL